MISGMPRCVHNAECRCEFWVFWVTYSDLILILQRPHELRKSIGAWCMCVCIWWYMHRSLQKARIRDAIGDFAHSRNWHMDSRRCFTPQLVQHSENKRHTTHMIMMPVCQDARNVNPKTVTTYISVIAMRTGNASSLTHRWPRRTHSNMGAYSSLASPVSTKMAGRSVLRSSKFQSHGGIIK